MDRDQIKKRIIAKTINKLSKIDALKHLGEERSSFRSKESTGWDVEILIPKDHSQYSTFGTKFNKDGKKYPLTFFLLKKDGNALEFAKQLSLEIPKEFKVRLYAEARTRAEFQNGKKTKDEPNLSKFYTNIEKEDSEAWKNGTPFPLED